MRLLLVEDDPRMRALVRRGLTEHGHVVEVASTGPEAVELAAAADFDVAVLDVMLPGFDGVEVVQRLRARANRTPVLMLTARDAASDVVRALDAGADDYLAKPFSFAVLVARLRALGRRGPAPHDAQLQVADLRLDPAARSVTRGGVLIALTRTEHNLLECLMRDAGRVVTRRALTDRLWGSDRAVESNTLDAFVKSLRHKIEAGGRPRLVHTVRGVGYSPATRARAMTPRSIRTRLTVWYLAVIVPATLALAIGSWWLARRSLNDEVDRTLAARLDGTREFLEAMAREGLHGDGMKEEFGEYVELSRGAVMLEVTDAAGTVLSRPSRPGWAALADEASLAAMPSAAPVDRVESGEPFRVARATFRAGAAEYRAVVATSTRASHDALRQFAWLLGGLAPAVLLIAGLGGYWIAGRALAPVDRMTRTVQETTLRSLDRRLDVPAADDELRRLAVTFNEMLARMQVGVADLTRLTAEASHELRTPVSLVRTTAEIALSRPRPADEYRQALKDVLAHAEHMSALVGDLLLLARADAGVEAGESSPVDLSEVARDVGEEFQLAAARRSLGFVVSAGTAVDVRGDAGSFRRLFVILLENAVVYTPPGGHIEVRVTRSDDARTRTAVVEVIDTGIGIDPDERARVFDRFYRGAAARAHAADGSGLGLSIARTIVERARGTIGIDAGPGGRGCHVRVRLPADGEGREVEHASGRTHRVDFDRVGAGVGGSDAAGR